MPRRVLTCGFVSLDGVMQAPGGPDEDRSGGFEFGGWLVPQSDEQTGAFVGQWFDRPFDLLLGRKTYDIFAGYWPQRPEHPIGEAFNKATKYVATSSHELLAWQNSVALHDPATDVARLKQQDGPDLITQGSTVLLHTLLAHRLVDEFRLMINPIILGKGKRLFDEVSAPSWLKLLESSVSSTGVIMAVYGQDGDVRTGSFMD